MGPYNTRALYYTFDLIKLDARDTIHYWFMKEIKVKPPLYGVAATNSTQYVPPDLYYILYCMVSRYQTA